MAEKTYKRPSFTCGLLSVPEQDSTVWESVLVTKLHLYLGGGGSQPHRIQLFAPFPPPSSLSLSPEQLASVTLQSCSAGCLPHRPADNALLKFTPFPDQVLVVCSPPTHSQCVGLKDHPACWATGEVAPSRDPAEVPSLSRHQRPTESFLPASWC